MRIQLEDGTVEERIYKADGTWSAAKTKPYDMVDHPRVKMTQAEFDELEKSLINAQFDYSGLKKTIEIVPDMKWFVRNKQKGKDDVIDQLMIDDDVWFGWHPFVTRDEATAFDTKEEAERWVNPLTEAVKLPVEVGNDIFIKLRQ